MKSGQVGSSRLPEFRAGWSAAPLHRLDRMWDELEESEQRLIVYGLFFGIPIATVWIAYKHC